MQEFLFVYGVIFTENTFREVKEVESFDDFVEKFRDFLRKFGLERLESQLGKSAFEGSLLTYYENWDNALSAGPFQDPNKTHVNIIGTGEWTTEGPYSVFAIPCDLIPQFSSVKSNSFH